MVLHHMLFSVDVETDGDSPAVSSMLSLGAVALHVDTYADGKTFYANLFRRPDAQPLNSTMSFWDGFPEAYARARDNLRDPKMAMLAFDEWVRETVKEEAKRLKAAGTIAQKDGLEPVFAAYPVGFDWSWVSHYLHLYTGKCVFGFSPFDMGAYASGVLKPEGIDLTPHSRTHRSVWPPEWVEGSLGSVPHHALEDAKIQAERFRRMLGIQPKPAKEEA